MRIPLHAAPSLTRHLLAWALAALTLVWAGFIVFGYQTGEHEADELTDGHLASVSSLLLPLAPGGFARGAAMPALARKDIRAHDYQRSLSVVVWDAQGRMLSRTGDAPPPTFGGPEGFATLRIGEPPTAWRAFSRWDEAHAYRLMVLLSEQERDELAADIAAQVVEPGLWLLPVVALVLGLAIHRGLRPLRSLAQQVHALDPQQAQKVQAPVRFQELAFAVDAINRLVDRYHAALTRERALANEFAHELRTPLASLALHARGARESAPGSRQQQEALSRLEDDALRAGDVLAHLLALARASRAELDEAVQPLDLDAVARRVVAEFAPHAHAGGRELGLSSPGPFAMSGHAVLLELALRNLVQNALAHTPRGTHVEVEIDPARRVLQVADDGPRHAGRAGEDQPDLQPLRLGLGHRVVEKVATLHGATFQADVPLPDARRAWRILFPAALQA
jgi:two-component system, OmpR family, sensor histidine kinase QseC